MASLIIGATQLSLGACNPCKLSSGSRNLRKKSDAPPWPRRSGLWLRVLRIEAGTESAVLGGPGILIRGSTTVVYNPLIRPLSRDSLGMIGL